MASYRAYYVGDKSRFAKWKSGNIPVWWPASTYLVLGGQHDTELSNQTEGTV